MEGPGLDGSVAFLQVSTISCLSSQLNQEKYLRTEDNQLRDWRGVLEASSINSPDKYNQIRQAADPFKLFLELWKHSQDATVSNLLGILEGLDRFDVIDDNAEKIRQDMKLADRLLKEKGLSLLAVENEIAGSEQVMTYDDIAMLKQKRGEARFDALILHDDADLDLALRMTSVLENQNIKVCLKDRDLLVGTLELDVVTRLISERCNKVVTLFTSNFGSSSTNNFYSMLAQHRSITENKVTFLPIVHGSPQLKSNITMLTKLSTQNPFFWINLCRNIKTDFQLNPNNPLPTKLFQVEETKEANKPIEKQSSNVSAMKSKLSPPPPPLANTEVPQQQVSKEKADSGPLKFVKNLMKPKKKNKYKKHQDAEEEEGSSESLSDQEHGSNSFMKLIKRTGRKKSLNTDFTDLGTAPQKQNQMSSPTAEDQIQLVNKAPEPPRHALRSDKDRKMKYKAIERE